MDEQQKLHFFIIDDDSAILNLYKSLFEKAGFTATAMHSSKDVLPKIIAEQPDCVISNGLIHEANLFQEIRNNKLLKQPKFIFVTDKHDRKQAFELGVDGYIPKPINPKDFVKQVLDVVTGKIIIKFWGVRGTLPVPGKNSLRYGGNTNCVTLDIAGKHFFIFDAGTGIKALSDYLVKENKFPISAKIFITHPHYDHIHGLPFFVPLYMKENQFELYGTDQGGYKIKELISGQMDTIYFPITIEEFSASLKFHDLKEESINIEDIHIETIYLNHPGKCLAYRVNYNNKTFCYITDNELYLENSANFHENELNKLIKFMQNADVVVIDATYSDEEYARKTNWGHSSISRVIEVAHKANIKLLCLYHHDLYQFDDEIDKKLQKAEELLAALHSKTKVIAPHEGDEITI